MNTSYKGRLLISTPDISGGIFSRSVVLIIEHNEEGAFGLILNKRNNSMNLKIKNSFDYFSEIYEGGPVENDKIFIIVKGKPVSEYSLEIDSEFYLTERIEDIILGILEGKITMKDFKVFAGYSGWSKGQLEEEIRQKMWAVVEPYNLDYTLANDQSLWKKIMQNLGGEFLLWANTPDDVSMN